MNKGIDRHIKEQFHIEDVDIRTYSPLTLAYIGDGIFDLVIRSVVVARGTPERGSSTGGQAISSRRTRRRR